MQNIEPEQLTLVMYPFTGIYILLGSLFTFCSTFISVKITSKLYFSSTILEYMFSLEPIKKK